MHFDPKPYRSTRAGLPEIESRRSSLERWKRACASEGEGFFCEQKEAKKLY
jgi:hypothetical protein